MPAFLPNDWERFAPVALPREKPVAQLVIHGAPPEPLLLEPGNNLNLCRQRGESIEQRRIDPNPFADQGSFHWCISCKVGMISMRDLLHDPADFQAKLLREREVPFIMSGNRHDRAGPVTHEHIVGDPNRNPFVIDRIDGVTAGKDPRLFLGQFSALQV